MHLPPPACMPAAATVSRGTLRLLFFLGGSARPPSLLTPPVWTDVASCNICRVQYRVVTTVLRALRDLRAP
eukprot:scaffold26539_cov62-Phaeocystis_antarctica.AAC.3